MKLKEAEGVVSEVIWHKMHNIVFKEVVCKRLACIKAGRVPRSDYVYFKAISKSLTLMKIYWNWKRLRESYQKLYDIKCIKLAHFSWFAAGAFLSVAWPTGVQLLVFFCSSVPVVLFDTPGISRCRSQHVSVESSSLLHHSIYLWFICFTWWSIDELENLHADRTTICFEPW